MSLWSQTLEAHVACMQRIQTSDLAVEAAAGLLIACLRDGGRVLICGNGGSAADAQHFAAELTGRFQHNRRALPVLALTTDTSILTAVGNDFGFDAVFARQVMAFGGPGDVLVAISTSGDSANVIQAVGTARTQGMHSIGLLGRTGGALRDQVDLAIVIPEQITARIQEAHELILHFWAEVVEQQFLPECA